MAIRLLSWLFLAVATIACLANGVTDTVTFGNYSIQFCDSQEPDSNATYLQQILLPRINSELLAVIADAHLGLDSRYGYGTFFKTADSISEVTDVYQRMTAGSSVPIRSAPSDMLPGLTLAEPSLVCVSDIQDIASLYKACTHSEDDIPLVHWTGTSFVGLCSGFWNQKEAPLARTDCPRVRGMNLSPNTMSLAMNRQALIVYELARMYLTPVGGSYEAMNVQDAVHLNATASLKNPASYALYYAGK